MSLLNIFESDKDGKRKSHIKNLISVALADGHLADEEWTLLTRVASRLGMSMEDIQNVRNNPDEVKFVAPKKYDEKMQQVNDLVSVMMVDGDVDQEELNLCKKIALKLDLLPRVINDLIDNAYNEYKSK